MDKLLLLLLLTNNRVTKIKPNFRPVSVLNILSGIYESFINNHLISVLNNIFSSPFIYLRHVFTRRIERKS